MTNSPPSPLPHKTRVPRRQIQKTTAVTIRNTCIIAGSLALVTAFILFSRSPIDRPRAIPRDRSSVQTVRPSTKKRHLPAARPTAPFARATASTRKQEESLDTETDITNKPAPQRDEVSSRKPPPETVPFKQKLPYSSATLYIQVLADGVSSDPSITGFTSHTFPSYRFPSYQYDRATMRITKFNGAVEFTGPITIHTVYGPGASKYQQSLYGRGTTDKDKEDGNTTLGFHEHCHRLDYIEYLLSNRLPEFVFRTGMTVQQYEAVQQEFERKFKAYIVAIGNYSVQITDEVGRKRSAYYAEATDEE
jgi:hypothetical protein